MTDDEAVARVGIRLPLDRTARLDEIRESIPPIE